MNPVFCSDYSKLVIFYIVVPSHVGLRLFEKENVLYNVSRYFC